MEDADYGDGYGGAVGWLCCGGGGGGGGGGCCREGGWSGEVDDEEDEALHIVSFGHFCLPRYKDELCRIYLHRRKAEPLYSDLEDPQKAGKA